MRDSYQTFFEHFKIDFSDIIKFGIEIDTIYPDKNEIENDWKKLIQSIENNKGKLLVSEGLDANYQDMINYAVFALIHLNQNSKK